MSPFDTGRHAKARTAECGSEEKRLNGQAEGWATVVSHRRHTRRRRTGRGGAVVGLDERNSVTGPDGWRSIDEHVL